MDVGERARELAAGEFMKVDFHIHTPESQCFSDGLVTPLQVVDAALAAGLQAIAVTDHNTFQGVDRVRDAGRRIGLTVFPGAEFSTASGHVLALFDPEDAILRLEALLDAVGVSPAARGDGAAFVRDGMQDVVRKIDESGGLAIAAHIERWPTGFLQTNERAKLKARIHGSPHLTVLEITQPQNKGLWNRGEMKGFPKRYACVQGSDAHALDDIGRRHTYARLPSLDLQGLRTAFNEHEDRIRFPEEMA
jgi:predicted metal-dependent phosphoesterase TrpH